MSASLTVCGSAGTHVGPGRACSGYLVTAGQDRLLLDCGNGSLANVQRRCALTDLDAVVVSHCHPDHFADLYSLYYALRFHPDGPREVAVHAPAGAEQFVVQLLDGDREHTFGQVCRFRDAAAGGTLRVGDVTVTFFRANHPIETLAMRLEAGGAVIAYSADSHTSAELVECARGADLFVCDATWLERQRPLPGGIHMTGLEAGRTATEAGVDRLLLTHVIPANDAAEVAAEASRSFDGEILVARDLQEIEL